MRIFKSILVSPRPSKQQFSFLLGRDAQRIPENGWVLDFATQGGKNRALFTRGTYVGADISYDEVAGLPELSYGVVTDIRRSGFCDASFDAVVSTHTLSHLAPDERMSAVRELSRLVAPGGILILNGELEEGEHRFNREAIRTALGSGFALERTVAYRGIVSRFYEDRFIEGLRSRSHMSRWAHRVLRIAAFCIGFLEYVTQTSHIGAREGYFLFRRTGDSHPDNRPLEARLACPQDRGALKRDGGSLRCISGGHTYQTRNGIPILLV